MPDYPGVIRRGGAIVRGYLDALGIVEGGQIDRLGDTVQPVLDLWRQPEWALLRNEVIFSRASTAGAVAARFSTLQLVVPATARVIVVVDQISIRTGNAAEIALTTGAAVGTVQGTDGGLPNDGRRLPAEISILQVTRTDTAAGITSPQWVIDAAALVPPPPFILVPGSNLFISEPNANVSLQASIKWRERPLLPTEDETPF